MKGPIVKKQGFTLLELIIVMSILSVMGLLSFAMVQASASAAATAEATGSVQAQVRNAMRALSAELQYGAKAPNHALDPILDDVIVVANPAPGSPVELSFQRPTDASGRNWTRRIRYRYVNEDANGNARLDPGEDTDRDGTLTRRIQRMQDYNGDGDVTDRGETRAMGGANDLSNVQIARNGSEVTFTLTATKLVGSRRTRPVSATVTGRVYLLN
jgi:prepilin-type N-terminal cleavage/methylation domain-containing protein